MNNLSDKVKLFAGDSDDKVMSFTGNPDDGGNNSIRFGIDVTLRDGDSFSDFEYFEDFLRDNLQSGKSTTFNYSERIVITQSDYNGGDLRVSDNFRIGKEVTISVPRNVRMYTLSRILSYSDQLTDLRNKYWEVACPGICPYYEDKRENCHGIIGYKAYMNFIIESPNSSLMPLEKELGPDAPKHFKLPVRLQPRAVNLPANEIYAERLTFHWFVNCDVIVDFYLDTSAVDDSYKYLHNGVLRMGKEVYGEATDQIGYFLEVNRQFITSQFIVVKNGGRLYFFIMDQGHAWDISDWVRGCRYVV